MIKIKQRIFNIFLRSFLDNNEMKIKENNEIDRYIICLIISEIEYSVPIKE